MQLEEVRMNQRWERIMSNHRDNPGLNLSHYFTHILPTLFVLPAHWIPFSLTLSTIHMPVPAVRNWQGSKRSGIFPETLASLWGQGEIGGQDDYLSSCPSGSVSLSILRNLASNLHVAALQIHIHHQDIWDGSQQQSERRRWIGWG